ncbi:MAG: diphosphomevalonate decarboxylase [Gammaproteobacteria bacterium]|nr:diphosphomevalonate decarboxylase [Gammaproteobacteria bacterium]
MTNSQHLQDTLTEKQTRAQGQQQFVYRVIGHSNQSNRLTPCKQTGLGKAPVNIALSKYWGKRDEVLNLPVNGSVSISLPGLGTETQISVIGASTSPFESNIKPSNETSNTPQDQIQLNGETLANDHPFASRLSLFLNPFRRTGMAFSVVTHNTVPTAAGLASSASGYAALVLALNDLFGWQLSHKQCSLLARLGSGSASRSLFLGFSQWHKGEQADGLDSYAESIDMPWPGFCIGLVKVDVREKPISSSVGMQNTVNTCQLYQAWPKQAEQDIEKVLNAIHEQDFELLGQTAEHNALTMHATMMATWPPIVYWQPDSLAAMQTVWKLREQGTAVYFTMDAGPNLKLLFLETEKPAIKQAFPDISIIEPFKSA